MLSCENNSNHNNNNNKNGGDDFIDIIQPSVNQSHIELINHLNQIKHVKCQCKKTNIFYDVHVINETVSPQQICFIMTIHDLGADSSQFDQLIHHEKMEGIRNRVIWLNVNLPGQEPESPDLNTKKYPSLEELGNGLESILDELKIPQVVCMGQGAGANVAFYFATKHASRCLGLVLIDPVGTSAGLVESIRHIFGNRKSIGGETPTDNRATEHRNSHGSILRIEKTGPGTSPESFHIEMVDPNKSTERRNSKNVAMFADAFFNRGCLSDQVHELKVDALIACGKNSPSYANSKKLYKAFQDINRKTPLRMVNSPLLELDNVTSVLSESADRLAVSLQYFLQGIGLLSAMPLRSSIRSSSICSGSPASPSHITSAAVVAANFNRSTSLDDENGNPNHSSGSSSAASPSNSESNSQSNLNNNNINNSNNNNNNNNNNREITIG